MSEDPAPRDSGSDGDADIDVPGWNPLLESLGRARMTQRHASDLVEAIDGVELEFREQLLPRAIELAEAMPLGTFRRTLQKLIATVRAVTLAERHERALENRRVFAEPADDAMGWLHWYGPMVEVRAIHGRLTSTAKGLAQHADERRTLDQLRADVFADILIDGVTDLLPLRCAASVRRPW